MTRQEFIDVIALIAVKLRQAGSSIFPSVRIAQAMLETGCVIHSWNNLVGYKVGSGEPNAHWKGRSVSTKTWEVYDGVRVDGVQAHWRAYDSIEDCFRDQDLLFERSRYDRVRTARSPQEQTFMLRACGYATDPVYELKLNSFISGFELEQYDVTQEVEEDMKLELWQWRMIGDALAGLSQVPQEASREPILSYTWAEKAYSQELSVSEALFILTVAQARAQGVIVEKRDS